MEPNRDTALHPTDAEQRLIGHLNKGAEADLGTGPADSTNMSLGTVRAEVLRALLAGGRAEWKASHGVYVRGARVVGRLDLSGVRLDRPMRFCGCVFTDTIVLSTPASTIRSSSSTAG
ncbi:hypothetical protein [Streptomyces sp. S.PB5]|uniref:hypothetical protein n=1 Tax=Streptomyces sp. S.PB5 TaxID=3020844 RepID=UPI0025B0DA2E|nr:hypothetical protein [Streptomyces sp. S.PB5]MDN3029012.1 hypothetical protein [Streptomyces sp. S.PB5]